MLDRLRWRITPAIVLTTAIIAGAYYLLNGATILISITVFLLTILIGSLVVFLVVDVLSTLLREESLFSGILDNSLLSLVRKRPRAVLWPTLVATAIFTTSGLLWIIVLYEAPPEIATDFMKTTTIYAVVALIVMVFGTGLFLLSHLTGGPRLSSALVNHITPELIGQKPQAAVEFAFTVFEHHLRQRIGAGPDLHGERLINAAYAAGGHLTYGTVESEQQGIRNLMAGAYATFRNPRKHRIVVDDEQTIQQVVVLVDLLIRLVDESNDRANP